MRTDAFCRTVAFRNETAVFYDEGDGENLFSIMDFRSQTVGRTHEDVRLRQEFFAVFSLLFSKIDTKFIHFSIILTQRRGVAKTQRFITQSRGDADMICQLEVAVDGGADFAEIAVAAVVFIWIAGEILFVRDVVLDILKLGFHGLRRGENLVFDGDEQGGID